MAENIKITELLKMLEEDDTFINDGNERKTFVDAFKLMLIEI